CILELYPRRSPIVVFKPIVPSYSISFKVDDSGVHHGILRCLVMTEVTLGTRNPSRRVSFFPSREVHPHTSAEGSVAKFSAKRVLLMLLFGAIAETVTVGATLEGAMEVAKDFCGSGLRLGRKV
ncbi:hypothetical protein BHM03_00023271, partial [Ensete ventricosum]